MWSMPYMSRCLSSHCWPMPASTSTRRAPSTISRQRSASSMRFRASAGGFFSQSGLGHHAEHRAAIEREGAVANLVKPMVSERKRHPGPLIPDRTRLSGPAGSSRPAGWVPPAETPAPGCARRGRPRAVPLRRCHAHDGTHSCRLEVFTFALTAQLPHSGRDPRFPPSPSIGRGFPRWREPHADSPRRRTSAPALGCSEPVAIPRWWSPLPWRRPNRARSVPSPRLR